MFEPPFRVLTLIHTFEHQWPGSATVNYLNRALAYFGTNQNVGVAEKHLIAVCTTGDYV